MANLVSKNVEKTVTSAVIVTVATASSVAIVKGCKVLGVDVDNAQITAAVTVALSGVLAGLQNWFAHRK